jgi:hypothetical protein
MIKIAHQPHWGFWEVLKVVSPTRTVSIGLFDSEAKAEAYTSSLYELGAHYNDYINTTKGNTP